MHWGYENYNNTSLKQLKLKDEVGMAGQKSMHTRVVGIVRYIVHPYCFSSIGISVKSSRDVVLCTLLSLLPLYAYFLTCHPYFTLQFYLIVFTLITVLFFPTVLLGKEYHEILNSDHMIANHESWRWHASLAHSISAHEWC